MTDSVVAVRNITRRFMTGSGRTVTALDTVTLDLPPAELVVVRGPSGCGKSTLLNLIGLLDRPDEGSLRVAGVELTTLDATGAARFRREHIGFLFQDGGLIEPMTVAANVSAPLVYRETPRRERARLVVAALERVGLADRSESAVAELSGGERQRVGLARALVATPGLLICDEPTAALDEGNSIEIAALLAERAREGCTVICSSHDPVLIQHAGLLITLRHGCLDEGTGA